jgi:Na+/proline symporter
MNPYTLLIVVVLYFALLLLVAWYKSKKSNNDSFFIGNRDSNWMLVAFGMIGTTLSGVTFVSVPGAVSKEAFAYLQITIGYLIGYFVIAFVLLPLYYRLQLVSIYNYLHTRLGFKSYKTGASFFILSRTLGATARLYLVVKILQDAILNNLHIPFWATTIVILSMILLYTFEGGVKTIVWTDTLQTSCMLAGLIICVVFILNKLNLGFAQSLQVMNQKGYTQIFFTNASSKLFFVKQILAGAFIAITMTGMDQEMMQKNISVKTLKNSQKNILSLSFIMVGVIALFLVLGGLLYLYADSLGAKNVTEIVNGKQVVKYMIDANNATADKIFPTLALHYMPPVFSIIFIIALISALFPSADGAITALTSSFCIDILGIKRRVNWNEAQQLAIRKKVHLSFACIFLLFVMLYKWIDEPSMIGVILKVAAYTYGPLLGLFTFGIICKKQVNDKLVPWVCIAAPIICFVIDKNQKILFSNFEIGNELLIINGLITMLGLLLISTNKKTIAND